MKFTPGNRKWQLAVLMTLLLPAICFHAFFMTPGTGRIQEVRTNHAELRQLENIFLTQSINNNPVSVPSPTITNISNCFTNASVTNPNTGASFLQGSGSGLNYFNPAGNTGYFFSQQSPRLHLSIRVLRIWKSFHFIKSRQYNYCPKLPAHRCGYSALFQTQKYFKMEEKNDDQPTGNTLLVPILFVVAVIVFVILLKLIL